MSMGRHTLRRDGDGESWSDPGTQHSLSPHHWPYIFGLGELVPPVNRHRRGRPQARGARP